MDSITISSENISYSFENEGIYEVLLIVTDANGCIDSTMQIVTITGDLEIPNVITDNSDGVNDTFKIQGLKANTSLVILNRWGQKVFETSNYENDWKGIDLSGDKLTEGVYTYLTTADHDTIPFVVKKYGVYKLGFQEDHPNFIILRDSLP